MNQRQSRLRGLYAIADTDIIPAGELGERVAAALRGGGQLVQYRDKSGDQSRRLEEALALRRLCHGRGVRFIVNDDIDLADRVHADGVHLGRTDRSLTEARERLGRSALIGISCYNELERAIAAADNGADYVAFGRFFASRTKPGAVTADLDLLRKAVGLLSVPVVAIGGITPENGAPLVAAGAAMIAAIEGVFGQADVESAARRYAQLFYR